MVKLLYVCRTISYYAFILVVIFYPHRIITQEMLNEGS